MSLHLILMLALFGGGLAGTSAQVEAVEAPELASVRITKEVIGEVPDNESFQFGLICNDTDKDGVGNAGSTYYSMSYVIRDDIPVGTECAAVETDTRGAIQTTWRVGDLSGDDVVTDRFIVEAGETEVFFTNTFAAVGADPGSVRVNIEVVGDAPDGVFRFRLRCDGADTFGSGPPSHQGSTEYGMSHVFSDDIQLGSQCHVELIDWLNASDIRWAVGDTTSVGTRSGSFVIGESETLVVFTNTFAEVRPPGVIGGIGEPGPGAVRISVQVYGEAPDSGFQFRIECDDARGGAGGNAGGSYALSYVIRDDIQVPSECVVEMTNDRGARAAQWRVGGVEGAGAVTDGFRVGSSSEVEVVFSVAFGNAALPTLATTTTTTTTLGASGPGPDSGGSSFPWWLFILLAALIWFVMKRMRPDEEEGQEEPEHGGVVGEEE